MGQVEMMYSNIDSIMEAINGINTNVNIGQPTFDIKEHFMTKRQAMKKIMVNGGNMTGVPDPTAGNVKMSPEAAHELVYGKLMYDDKGKLVDNEKLFPECVDKKTKVKDSHPMMMMVENKKLEVTIAFDQLKSKSVEIAEASKQLTIETTAGFITVGSSAAVLPFGAGIPTAFSALQGIFSALQAFQTKINQILPILEPLTFITVLIVEDMINTIVGMINGLLGTVNVALSAVAGVLSVIGAIKDLLPSGPDGELLTEELQLDSISASNTSIQIGGKTTLNATASNGSWQYIYKWKDKNTGSIISQEQQVEVEPLSTRKYSCTVSDENSDAEVYGEITIIVTN